MVKTLVILAIALVPAGLSLWGTRRGQRLAQARLLAATRAYPRTGRSFCPPSSQPEHQSEQHYLQGVGVWIGDLSCRHNARSPHLRCAVNPYGPCDNCLVYESIQGLENQ